MRLEQAGSSPQDILRLAFWRLYENEFVTLDGLAMSMRGVDGIAWLDETTALRSALLGEAPEPAAAPSDAAIHAAHLALHEQAPHIDTVISGWSWHLRALLQEGLALPSPTSMLRNRGVTALGDHLVASHDIDGERLAATIGAAIETARRKEMDHVLVITGEGMVIAAGAPPFAVMAHWHNIEFAARVECLRIEEALVHGDVDGGMPLAPGTPAHAGA
jgi:hypothetical protein